MIGRTVSGHAVRIHATVIVWHRGVTVWWFDAGRHVLQTLQSAALTPAGHRVCPDSVTTHLCVFEDGALHPCCRSEAGLCVACRQRRRHTDGPRGADSVVLEGSRRATLSSLALRSQSASGLCTDRRIIQVNLTAVQLPKTGQSAANAVWQVLQPCAVTDVQPCQAGKAANVELLQCHAAADVQVFQT